MWNDVLSLNRLTRLLVVVALAFSVYVVARWAVNQPVFAIRVITVQGVAAGANAGTGTQPLDHVHAAQVAQFCVPRIAGTLFTNDLDVTRAAFEALPWVRRATVRRQWPNRLVVALEEHQALARWNDEDGNRFVSVAGEAFDAPGEKVIGAALPLLLGPEGTEKEVAQRFRDFSERLARIAQTPAVVALSPRQAWTIRLKRSEAGPTPAVGETPHEGLLLDLGREQPRAPVLARLDRFVTHYAATLGRLSSRIEAVDLRYPNGFAARIPGFHATRTPTAKPVAAKTAKKPVPKKPNRNR